MNMSDIPENASCSFPGIHVEQLSFIQIVQVIMWAFG